MVIIANPAILTGPVAWSGAAGLTVGGVALSATEFAIISDLIITILPMI